MKTFLTLAVCALALLAIAACGDSTDRAALTYATVGPLCHAACCHLNRC